MMKKRLIRIPRTLSRFHVLFDAPLIKSRMLLRPPVSSNPKVTKGTRVTLSLKMKKSVQNLKFTTSSFICSRSRRNFAPTSTPFISSTFAVIIKSCSSRYSFTLLLPVRRPYLWRATGLLVQPSKLLKMSSISALAELLVLFFGSFVAF